MEINYEFAANGGRILLGLGFAVFGGMKIMAFKQIEGWLKSVGVPAASLAVIIATVIEIAGGIAIIANYYTAPIAILMAGYLLVVSIMLHKFWGIPEEQKQEQTTNFIKNLIIIGALLTMTL